MTTINEIRTRRAAITPGEWYRLMRGTWVKADTDIGIANIANAVPIGTDNPLDAPQAIRNAEFIAAAPADIDYLLATIDKLVALVVESRASHAVLSKTRSATSNVYIDSEVFIKALEAERERIASEVKGVRPMTTITDLLTLDADDPALRRGIAELLGWKVQAVPLRPVTYRVFDRNGNEVIDSVNASWFGDWVYRATPDWPHSVDAALGLEGLGELEVSLDWRPAEEPQWSVFIDNGGSPEDDNYRSGTGSAPTAALAIVRAWLAYKASSTQVRSIDT